MDGNPDPTESVQDVMNKCQPPMPIEEAITFVRAVIEELESEVDGMESSS